MREINDDSRIAFAGDWHANLSWARKAIRHAVEQGADIIVHLGDFGYDFTNLFVGGLNKTLDEADLDLWFVDGNHEDFPELERRKAGGDRIASRIRHLERGTRWEWAGVRFMGFGGAHSVDRPWRRAGVSWWPEEAITTVQVMSVGTEPVDVLVAHDCPSGVDIPGLASTAHLWPDSELEQSDQNRLRLAAVVDRVHPARIWHGHYHRRYDAVADLGYGPVEVTGLDCDESGLASNVQVVRLEDLTS